MSNANKHQLIELAGQDGCRILYCERCDVTELRIAEFRVNIEPNSMKSLESMIGQANEKLDQYKTMQTRDELMQRLMKTIHD